MDVTGKKAVVVGLARSGVGAANLLNRLGALVTVTDKKKPEDLRPYIEELLPGIRCCLGSHPPELFREAEVVVISPGVPLSIAPLREAAAKGVRIIGELELFYQAMGAPENLLAITGTNGKSTTTALLDAMLKRGGFSTLLGGNIGNALTKALAGREQAPDFVVAEVSSFQLETVHAFKPKGAAILNITPDHLDRYASIKDYIDAKCRIFLNQDEHDFLVLNADDPVSAEIVRRIDGLLQGKKPRIFYFSRGPRRIEGPSGRNRNPDEGGGKGFTGACYRNGVINYDLPGIMSFTLASSLFRIKGVHNIENAMAASIMALLSGCSPGAVVDTLADFPGLEHRLEFVREVNGVSYINDSKGTNVGAVVKSIESFDAPVILIAGGRDKDGDFTVLRPLAKERVKALVLIGEARDKIKKSIGDCTNIVMESALEDAVRKARELASAGDVVLLSPACASFDMFRDFEDRGKQFKAIVGNL